MFFIAPRIIKKNMASLSVAFRGVLSDMLRKESVLLVARGGGVFRLTDMKKDFYWVDQLATEVEE